jgi:hypothetical protein
VRRRKHTSCLGSSCSETEGQKLDERATDDSGTDDTKEFGSSPEAEGGKPKTGSGVEGGEVSTAGGSCSASVGDYI